jgi:hypothetical protein
MPNLVDSHIDTTEDYQVLEVRKEGSDMERLLRVSTDTRDARDKTRFAQFTRSIIRAVAVAFGVLVACLQIKDIRPDAVLTPSSADIIWRTALVGYYWSWVAGINFDINVQELTYVAFPGQGRWPLRLYVVLAIFVVMAVVLLTSFGNIARFSLALTGFLIVDHASWLYVRRFLRKSIDDSRSGYAEEGRHYELEILGLVERQVFGQWKLWRLMAGAAIVTATDVFAFNQAFREAIGSTVQIICPWLSSADAISLSYSVLFLLYVLVMELWLWLHRIRMYLRLDTLEYLNERYRLTPR